MFNGYQHWWQNCLSLLVLLAVCALSWVAIVFAIAWCVRALTR